MQFADPQECYNGGVAVKKRSALRSVGVLVRPRVDQLAGNPEGKVASIEKSLVVFRPGF